MLRILQFAHPRREFLCVLRLRTAGLIRDLFASWFAVAESIGVEAMLDTLSV